MSLCFKVQCFICSVLLFLISSVRNLTFKHENCFCKSDKWTRISNTQCRFIQETTENIKNNSFKGFLHFIYPFLCMHVISNLSVLSDFFPTFHQTLWIFSHGLNWMKLPLFPETFVQKTVTLICYFSQRRGNLGNLYIVYEGLKWHKWKMISIHQFCCLRWLQLLPDSAVLSCIVCLLFEFDIFSSHKASPEGCSMPHVCSLLIHLMSVYCIYHIIYLQSYKAWLDIFFSSVLPQ